MENDEIIDINFDFEQTDTFDVIDIRGMKKYAEDNNKKIGELSEDEQNMFYIGLFDRVKNEYVEYNPKYYKYKEKQ